MYNEALYDHLMEQPDADRIVARAAEQLQREAKARREFREWLTPSIKAEFINGEIIVHSPARRGHLVAGGNLYKLLNLYASVHELGEVYTEKALVEMGRNDFEPDVGFWRNEQATDWTDETTVFPPPTLVVEVLSETTEARDRGIKFQSYLAHEVPEYWIVDTRKQRIEQYVLRIDGDDTPHYDLRSRYHGEQLLECQAIPGLQFPAAVAFSDARSLSWVRDLLG